MSLRKKTIQAIPLVYYILGLIGAVAMVYAAMENR